MNKNIIVIVKDDDDRAYWTPYMQAVSDSVALIEHHQLLDSLGQTGDITRLPALIALSSKIYPEGSSHLVEILEQRFPDTEILLIVASEDPLPQSPPLVSDNIRHIVIIPENTSLLDTSGRSLVSLAIRKIAEKGLLKINEYLEPDTVVQEFRITSSDQKETLIGSLENSISGESMEIELLRQKGALLADEMLENAFYGAPRGKNGAARYPKGMERHLSTREEIIFRYGFDGVTLAMEVTDSWGSLSPRIAWENIAKQHESLDLLAEEGGRGLFIMWRFLDHLHIQIDPGRQTVVGGQVKLMTAENLPDKKGLHITTNGRA